MRAGIWGCSLWAYPVQCLAATIGAIERLRLKYHVTSWRVDLFVPKIPVQSIPTKK